MLRFSDQIHDRKDEETISLVNQLNSNTKDNETGVSQLDKVPSKTNKKKKVNKVPNHKNSNSPSSGSKKEDEE